MAVHIRLIKNNIKRHIKRIVCGFLPASHRTPATTSSMTSAKA